MKRKTISKHSDFVCSHDCIVIRGDLFMIKAKPVRENATAKYGLVASKREFRLAVQRNRAKRLMRDWIAYNEELMSPKYDYIFMLNNAILDSSRENGRKETEIYLKKVSKIIKENEK